MLMYSSQDFDFFLFQRIDDENEEDIEDDIEEILDIDDKTSNSIKSLNLKKTLRSYQ